MVSSDRSAFDRRFSFGHNRPSRFTFRGSVMNSVPGSAWDGTFQKLCFQLRVSKQSFGGARSQAEPGNEWALSPQEWLREP